MIALSKAKLNSANIQADFYMRCKLHNIPCILEYKHERCRFDAIIHDDKHILEIVEIKNHKRPWREPKPTKQTEKYRAYGLPVFHVRCYADINQTVEAIKRIVAL